MQKGRLITFRIPEVEYQELKALAKHHGTTMTDLFRDAMFSTSWRAEYRRNVEYHREAIQALTVIKKRLMDTTAPRVKVLKSSRKASKRRKAKP